jgi:molybdate transport system regulatory protein
VEKGAVMQGQSERDGPLEIRSKIWIERRGRGDVVLSEWRVELLEAIDAHGSLSRAAEALGVPYRTAWERVKATEGEIGFRLLDSESGGLDGGGSHLTPRARELCRRFRRVSGGIQEVVSRRFAAEFGDGREGMQSVSLCDVNGTS